VITLDFVYTSRDFAPSGAYVEDALDPVWVASLTGLASGPEAAPLPYTVAVTGPGAEQRHQVLIAQVDHRGPIDQGTLVRSFTSPARISAGRAEEADCFEAASHLFDAVIPLVALDWRWRGRLPLGHRVGLEAHRTKPLPRTPIDRAYLESYEDAANALVWLLRAVPRQVLNATGRTPTVQPSQRTTRRR
jgi:hypothetical protein